LASIVVLICSETAIITSTGLERRQVWQQPLLYPFSPCKLPSAKQEKPGVISFSIGTILKIG
jgi:hypothetical protein